MTQHSMPPTRAEKYWKERAALTAAAEVGEPTIEQIEDRLRKFKDAVQNIENKAIERCAQVARPILIALLDLHEDELTQQQRSFITDQFERKFAAAIRELKEQSIDPNLQYPGKDPDFVFPEE